MKVTYDANADVHIVTIEDLETTTYIKANSLSDVRDGFLNRMRVFFDDAVCDSAGIDEAIHHFKYGISHDIFNETVAGYAKLAIMALEKYKSN